MRTTFASSLVMLPLLLTLTSCTPRLIPLDEADKATFLNHRDAIKVVHSRTPTLFVDLAGVPNDVRRSFQSSAQNTPGGPIGAGLRLATDIACGILRGASDASVVSYSPLDPGMVACIILKVTAGGPELPPMGEKLISAYSLQDPIVTIKNRFLENIGRFPGIPLVENVQNPINEDRFFVLKAWYKGGVILDFRTHIWRLVYFGRDDLYRLRLIARARLIKLSEERVMWQGVCEVEDSDSDIGHSLLELIADGGRLLKEEWNRLAEACAAQILEQFGATIAP